MVDSRIPADRPDRQRPRVERPEPPRRVSGAYHHTGDRPPETPPAGLEETLESPPVLPPVEQAQLDTWPAPERPTEAKIRQIEERVGPVVYPAPGTEHAGRAPRKDSPPPGSLRSVFVDAVAGDDPKARARARLLLTIAAFLFFGGGAGMAKLWGRSWLDVFSRDEARAECRAIASAAVESALKAKDGRMLPDRVDLLEASAVEAARRAKDEADKKREAYIEELETKLSEKTRRTPYRDPKIMIPEDRVP